MRHLPMSYLKELFTAPPDTYVLQQRHDVAGLLAALGHTLPWMWRNGR